MNNNFYRKGILETNYLQKGFYLFITLFFSTLICLLIDSTNNFKRKSYLIIISLLNGFFLNISILSRMMAFQEFSIIFPTIKKYFYQNFYSILKIFIFFILIFSLSVIVVNKERKIKINSEKNNNIFYLVKNDRLKTKVYGSKNNKIDYKQKNYILIKAERILVYRWVGYDALYNTNYINSRNLKMLKEKNSYKKYIIRDYDLVSSKDKTIGSIVTPGIFATVNYSKSIFVSSLFLLILVSALFILEKFTYYFTSSSSLTSFLTFLFTWRLIHMGNSIYNTIILYFILLSIPLIIYFFNKWVTQIDYKK